MLLEPLFYLFVMIGMPIIIFSVYGFTFTGLYLIDTDNQANIELNNIKDEVQELRNKVYQDNSIDNSVDELNEVEIFENSISEELYVSEQDIDQWVGEEDTKEFTQEEKYTITQFYKQYTYISQETVN